MIKKVYITGTEAHSGKSVITIGLVNMLLGKAQKVVFFKPISSHNGLEKTDYHIETILNYFDLPVKYEDAYACTWEKAVCQWETEKQGELLDTIIQKFRRLEEKYDFTVVEGTDYPDEGCAFEFEMNLQIAKNLRAPVIIVTSGEDKTATQVANAVSAAIYSFKAREVQVLAVIANKIMPENVRAVEDLLSVQLSPGILLSVIPEDINLRSPTMNEILEKINGKILFGKDQLANHADNFLIGAMQVPDFLHYLKKNVLIITPGDRGDIIISALQANLSANYPKVAGIILTTGYQPEESVLKLINGLENVVPVISVESETFPTSVKVAAIRSKINADNTQKIQLAIDTFTKFVNVRELQKLIISSKPSGITPRIFQCQLIEWARRSKKSIVLPEGTDERILKAAAKLVAQELVDIILFGHENEIRAIVKQLDIDLDLNKVHIVHPASDPNFNDFTDTLYELRKNKNMTREIAHDLMMDSSYFGTMMVYKGYADGMVSGAVNTTQHTIKPALQFIKTKPGVSLVSSIFFMCLPGRVCIFGDCAVNPNPTAEELAEIAISSAESSKRFGIEPKVAMLSYSSGTSGIGEDVAKVRRATEIVRIKFPDLKIEGPIQYDAAVDPAIGKNKLPGSEVAGQASVLIFPDLNSGNNIYKAIQRETGALAIGPILQGLRKPVNDLSRGCTVDDVFNTVIINAIQCQDIQ
ncbi:phosphate acetyltransferase [Mucilaginibacter sp. E4BP6]|uniref:phosphate acetyltransferase n=1 Tax=Mucilaginibacter sp. E4BP6 TaxID=2723089 RepID=UPI0015CB40F0|nr:phosphate acetyltransferase [Mucilaginibacter sp. E4BP6]NYE64388.1 phosphate acetyltransferase [Mucilaginibacter sp. E4BP6]